MATFTVPRTWVSGSVTSAQMNTIRDGILELQAANTNAGFGEIQGSTPASAPFALPTSAWTAPGLSATDYILGDGLTRSTAGVTAINIGRYDIFARVAVTGNSTGRRLMGVDVAGLGAAGPTQIRWDMPAGTASTQYLNAVGSVVTTSASQGITLYVYQESGIALQVLDRILRVRRIY